MKKIITITLLCLALFVSGLCAGKAAKRREPSGRTINIDFNGQWMIAREGGKELWRTRRQRLAMSNVEAPPKTSDFEEWARESSLRVESLYGRLLDAMAQKHKMRRKLVKAIVMLESDGNPYAVSRAGAEGLVQLMPVTAEELGVRNTFNPVENLDGGLRYFKKMLKRFGSIDAALVAFNVGPGDCKKMLQSGLDPAKHRYVRKINRIMKII